MGELGRLEHHNEVSFYIGDELKLKGEILIDNKNYCEGIVYNNLYFVYGTFVKYNYLELKVGTMDLVKYEFYATKGYLKYKGECVDADSGNVEDFYLKARGLDVDLRDYGRDNPKYIYFNKLKVFKDIFNLGDTIKHR